MATISKTLSVQQLLTEQLDQRIEKPQKISFEITKIVQIIQSYAKSGSIFFNRTLFESAKSYMDTSSRLDDAFQLRAGIFVPKDLPIIIKAQNGKWSAADRFKKMQQAFELSYKNGYEHIVIPQARIYGNFIIETLLPVKTKSSTIEQMGLYIENRTQFSDAIKEFTGFLCQSYLGDILGNNRDPYGALSNSPMPRYDNLPLYIVDGQGKIGLVDLEEFHLCKPNSIYSRVLNVVHLYPYHLEEILNAAKKFDPDIEKCRKLLFAERDKALKRLKIAYEDHLKFIQEKKLSIEHPLFFKKVEPNKIKDIQQAISQSLLEAHESDDICEGCLGNEPEKVLVSFNEKTSMILEVIYEVIQDELDFNLKEKGPISSTCQLLSIRTVLLDGGRIFEKLTGLIADELKKLNIKYIKPTRVIDTICEELVKLGYASYYTSSFGYGASANRCIFC
jgi:hypothetical protein